MTDIEWLASLKAGDEVVITDGYPHGEKWLSIVERTTATKIVLGTHEFRRKDGWEFGVERWCRYHLRQPTPELREQVWRKQATKKLKAMIWDHLPTETLQLVLGMVEASNEVTNPRK